MSRPTELPPRETLQLLLQQIAPGSQLLAIEPLPGSYSNLTHLVNARSSDGSGFRVVVRRYLDLCIPGQGDVQILHCRRHQEGGRLTAAQTEKGKGLCQ